VLLEASFGAADSVYRDDRNAHPNVRFYTFAPEKFVLPELFPGSAGETPRRTSFTGSLVRNHFEQPPAHPDPPAEIATDVTVGVRRVVHHRKFDPQDVELEHLTYLLFGKGTELFLAHRITRSPAITILPWWAMSRFQPWITPGSCPLPPGLTATRVASRSRFVTNRTSGASA
jgi:hypothetical protein